MGQSIAYLLSATGDDIPVLGSLYHPFGFTMIKIAEADGVILRCHVWRNYQPTPEWPIHTHVFDLESQVIAGELTNVDYEHKLDPAGDHALYEVLSGKENSILSRTDQQLRLTELPHRSYKSGDSYSIPQGKFHRTIMQPGASCATLMHGTNYQYGTTSLVAGRLDGAAEYVNARHPVDPEKALEDLHWVLENA